MKTTVVGPLMDRDGAARRYNPWARNRYGVLEARNRQWSTPSRQVRRRQAALIPVDVDHSLDWIGETVHIEYGPDDKVWAVAMIDDPGFDPSEWTEPVFWSPTLRFDTGTGDDCEIRALSLTHHPAELGLGPLRLLSGDLSYRGASDRWTASELDPFRRAILERAAETHVFRNRTRDPIMVADPHEFDDVPPLGSYEQRQMGTLRHSLARGRVLDVR